MDMALQKLETCLTYFQHGLTLVQWVRKKLVFFSLLGEKDQFSSHVLLNKRQTSIGQFHFFSLLVNGKLRELLTEQQKMHRKNDMQSFNQFLKGTGREWISHIFFSCIQPKNVTLDDESPHHDLKTGKKKTHIKCIVIKFCYTRFQSPKCNRATAHIAHRVG